MRAVERERGWQMSTRGKGKLERFGMVMVQDQDRFA